MLGLLALFLALLAVSPAPLTADHNELSLTPVSDLPLVPLRHLLPDHPAPAERAQLAPPPPPCDKNVDLTSTLAGVISVAAQDNLICTSADIDTYVGQDGKTYVVQAGAQDAAWVHTDVSNPPSPVLVATSVWSGPAGANTYTPDVKAFSQGVRDYISLSLERLGSPGFCGVVIVDVTDPLSAVIVGGQQFIGADWCDSHNTFVESIGGDGRYIYAVADATDDMRVLEINSDLTACDYDPGTSAPDCLTEIGRYTHPDAGGSNNVHDITVIDHGGSVGRRVYVSYWNAGLMILDASHVTPGVIEVGSTNQPLNAVYSIDPAGFLSHHAYPSEDGTRVFIQDEFLSSAGQEPVQMWDIASPASPSYVDGISLGSALMPVVNPAHNLLVVGNRLYAGWYKAGLQAFDFDSTGFVGRPIYHQVQTEAADDPYDGAWGVRLATIGTATYVFQSDRRYGLIVDATLDADGDGMPDTYEAAHPCLSPLIDDAALDPDGDGWTNLAEFFIGTDPCDACPDDPGHDAWAADTNNDTFSDIADIVAIAGSFSQAVPPAPARHDIAPDPLDAFVDITDIVRIAAFFGQSCTP